MRTHVLKLLHCSSLLSLTLVFSGCDEGASVAPVDASVDARADAGRAYACDGLMEVEAPTEGVVTLSFDTSMLEVEPRDLGLYCGNPEPTAVWPPQQAIAVRIPGTGPMALVVSTINEGTDPNFGTLIQFRDSCEAAPSSRLGAFSCFVNRIGLGDDFRTAGVHRVHGGDTAYVLVSGYVPPIGEDWNTSSEGPVQVDISLRSLDTPTLMRASLRVNGSSGDMTLSVSGDDADGDVTNAALFFYREGELLDLYEQGEATESESFYSATLRPSRTPSFQNSVRLAFAETLVNDYPLALWVVNILGADEVGIRVYDEAGEPSELRKSPLLVQ